MLNTTLSAIHIFGLGLHWNSCGPLALQGEASDQLEHGGPGRPLATSGRHPRPGVRPLPGDPGQGGPGVRPLPGDPGQGGREYARFLETQVRG